MSRPSQPKASTAALLAFLLVLWPLSSEASRLPGSEQLPHNNQDSPNYGGQGDDDDSAPACADDAFEDDDTPFAA
ncbi:MAG: hypothetical protein VX498_15655, partial [Myxococcota bacterium]|nr:hypothetical protein [Myxococcota bacterium]